MKHISLAALSLVLLTSGVRAETAGCEPGRLMDAASVTEKRTSQGTTYTIKLQRDDDVIYTVETVATPSFDPKRLTNRETLTLCIADRKLTIRRQDGSELKTAIVREVQESNY